MVQLLNFGFILVLLTNFLKDAVWRLFFYNSSKSKQISFTRSFSYYRMNRCCPSTFIFLIQICQVLNNDLIILKVSGLVCISIPLFICLLTTSLAIFNQLCYQLCLHNAIFSKLIYLYQRSNL